MISYGTETMVFISQPLQRVLLYRLRNLLRTAGSNDWRVEEIIVALQTDTLPWGDLPIAFKDRRGLPARDTGIDCANETLAIQVKRYNTCSSVTWKSMASFFGTLFMSDPPFDQQWLIVNDDVKVVKYGKGKYVKKPLSEETRVKWIGEAEALLDDEVCTIPKAVDLRWYQEEAMEVIEEGGEEVKVEMATGSGKTHLIAHYIINHEEEYVLITVPSIVLLDQTRDVMAAYGIATELFGTGHNDNVPSEQPKVVISVDLSLRCFSDSYSFDMMFVDESHHYYEPYDDPLDSPSIEEGMAELSIKKGKKAGSIDDVKRKRTVIMSATLGCSDYSYGLRTAIEEEYLSDYDIYVPVYSLPITYGKCVRLIKHNPEWRHILIYCNLVMDAHALSWKLNEGGITSFSFDSATPSSKRVEYIDSMKRGDCRCLVTVNTLSEGIDIPVADTCLFFRPRSSKLAIVQCVGRVLRLHREKSIAHIVLPTSSSEKGMMTTLLRAMTEKDWCVGVGISEKSTRVSSSPIDDSADVDCELIGESFYDSLGKVTWGLWDVWYELVKEYAEINGKPPVATGVYRGKKIGPWCDSQRQIQKGNKGFSLTQEQVAKLNSIKGWYWEVDLDALWTVSYEILLAYIKENGRIPPGGSGGTWYRGRNIGAWCTAVRSAWKGGPRKSLTQSQIERLETIEGWFWEVDNDALWEEFYEALLAYVEENGKIPGRNAEYRGKKLGGWCHNQRGAWKGRAYTQMNQERVGKLEEVKGWFWEIDRDAPWMENYEVLLAYIEEYGKSPAQAMEYRGKKIGLWCTSQRSAKTGTEARNINPEQVGKLNSIPLWGWNAREIRMKANLVIFKRFHEANGYIPMPGERSEGVIIGNWVKKMRAEYHTGKLSPDEIALFNGLEGWVW